jgi:hypothetical protein
VFKIEKNKGKKFGYSPNKKIRFSSNNRLSPNTWNEVFQEGHEDHVHAGDKTRLARGDGH